MKNLIIILFLISSLFANPWCPITGLKISEHLETSYQAKLEANDVLRVYSSVYALLEDMENYGVYDIKAYDVKSKTYIHVKEEDLEEAKKSLHVKQKQMREVYKKRAYPMGKKLYEKRCPKDIDIEEFLEISDLKEVLQQRCDLKDETYLHATAVYLWDVKREGGVVAQESKIHVHEDEKCPICGMYVYKYPRWAAQIYYVDKHYSFDGVKDLMKYYFEHQKGITKILVSDYYSQHAIDGYKAYYVIGSDKYGPMGHELIPFINLEDAKNFMRDHKGKKLLKFDKVTQEDVTKLD
ncbi:nitrous oxide reductase accessory protein NosL [Sulfurospirillum arcachonense]|uniref:nitrous oxide reductase accessory protein NosL n=1 Tax=Sulfurospirillum arcachonense TaxID=57666 RepID=UPI000468223D|nr:nitrous oxide reductase accessory protein NosL [Sulfurospirillum arcachonense]